jgi:hypothetical protein
LYFENEYTPTLGDGKLGAENGLGGPCFENCLASATKGHVMAFLEWLLENSNITKCSAVYMRIGDYRAGCIAES